MGVLLDIKGDIGEIKGTITGHAASIASQGVEVQKLQLAQAKQRGFVAAISAIGAFAGVAIGAAADYFSRGNH